MQFDIPDSIKFCPKCGEKLMALMNDMVKTGECPECGESNIFLGIHCGAYCYHCGHDMQEVSGPNGSSQPQE